MLHAGSNRLISALLHSSLPLAGPGDLEPLMRAVKDARYVLLGEASHGTHEFYTWRTEITKRLVLEQQCSFIAVEGDWPDCYRLNRYIKGLPGSGDSAEQVLHAFDRWPTWMWANREIVSLAEWLRRHNDTLPQEQKVGFYGLDVYSLWDSMDAVVEYLEKVDPLLAQDARKAYRCFEPYAEDPQAYAKATVIVPTSCEEEAVRVLRALRAKAPEYLEDGIDSYYNAEQNALVAQGAERYYRAMVRGGPASWNIRDRHMAETLERLMHFHGKRAKTVVWEHNTHVGDARFTDMAAHGMVNLGQLVREAHDKSRDVVLVGFGTYSGTVLAARHWGAPMERMPVPNARSDSLEDLLHRTATSGGRSSLPNASRDLLLIFDGSGNGGIAGLDDPVQHRAIGVVYNPEAERRGNYVPTVLPRRYDAFLFIDHTRAVDALHMAVQRDPDVPETFPSGM